MNEQPHSIEAEERVLGSLIIDPEAYLKVAKPLNVEDFYLQKNAWIYDVVQTLKQSGRAVDFGTLCDELERRNQLDDLGGAAYITDLITVVPSALHVEDYADTVIKKAARRRLIATASRIAQWAYQNDLEVEEAQARAEAAVLDARRGTGGLITSDEMARDLWEKVENWQANPTEIRGLPTGLDPLDKMLGGMSPGLYLLAARPSVGKTAIALQVAANVARRGLKTLYFTLEMSVEQLAMRLASSLAEIEWDRVKRGVATSDELGDLAEGLGEISEWPFSIHRGAVTAGDIRAIAQREGLRGEVGLVVVDYLSLMSAAKEESTRNLELGAISRGLLLAAQDLAIPILALHQLNRGVENRQNKRPLMSDLRESGRLEEDADVILMLYREGYYNPDHEDANIMEIWVRKNRLGGPSGIRAEMFWHGELMRLENLA
jgi:replicative DNA helicase